MGELLDERFGIIELDIRSQLKSRHCVQILLNDGDEEERDQGGRNEVGTIQKGAQAWSAGTLL
jgi:hypothetical protein